MGGLRGESHAVVAPTVPWKMATVTLFVCVLALWALDARAKDFGTIASALGLYSAGLLGVFGVLNTWRSAITKRRSRYQQVEDKWRAVIDRSVKFALKGSALSFVLMLFGVIAPAVKAQVASVIGPQPYDYMARSVSALAITGVVALGMVSLQIVRDINAVYDWNNKVEELDAVVEEQRAVAERRKNG